MARKLRITEKTSRITARGQTTVPKVVREALGVDYGGRIAFRVEGERVTVHRADGDAGRDPAIAAFLSMLEGDIAAGNVRAELPQDVRRALDEVAGLEIDPDEEIEGEVEIE